MDSNEVWLWLDMSTRVISAAAGMQLKDFPKKIYFSHKSARVLKNVIDRSAKGDFHSIMLKGVCKNHECQSIYIFSSKKTMDHMLNEKLVNNEF